MKLNRFLLAFLILFVLLTTTVSAVAITIEPSELFFENVLNGGYAEEIIKISSDSSEPAQISLSATGFIKPWIIIEPLTASVNNASPAQFKVSVKPENASKGIYEGYIIINAVSGNKLTGMLTTSAVLITRIKITDREIMQAIVRNLTIPNIEKGSPAKVSATIENMGNIRANIDTYVRILDKDKKIVMTQHHSQHNIFPSAISSLDIEIPNNLETGQYWAEITILFDGMLLRKELSSFDIVEKREQQKEAMVVFKEEPAVSLAANWPIIAVWVLVLMFIGWKIVKSRKR